MSGASRRSTAAGPRRAGSRAGAASGPRPLWRCPRCGKYLVTRNMYHSCARYPLSHHFGGKPRARALFDHFRRTLERFGPVRLISNKTGVGFMVRVRFAGVTHVGKDWLRCGMWLTRRVPSRRWVRVDRYAPRAYIHRFEMRKPSDLDAEIRRYLRESYAVGCQLHLSDRAGPRRRPSR